MEAATVSTPAPSAPAAAPASTGSSSSAPPAASPTAQTTSGSGPSEAKSARELAREYAKKVTDKLTAAEAPAAESDTSDGTSTLEEATAPVEKSDVVEAKADKEAAESSPKDATSLKISEALKAIPDKKVQNEIRALAYAGKEFRDLHMVPAEAKELRALYPSLEVARQANESARVAYDIAQAFHSGSPEGFDHVMSNFQQANPAAFDKMLQHFAEKLPTASKESYQRLAYKSTASLIGNFQRWAEMAANAGRDAEAHELSTTAQILMERVFPNGMAPQRQRQPNQNDPVTQELNQLRAERAQMEQQHRQGLMQSVNTGYNSAVSKEAMSVIKAATEGGAYKDKALERMASDVVNRVRDKVHGNDHVRMAVTTHLNTGNGEAALNYLTQAARQYIATEAADVLREYAETFGDVQSARIEKQEQAIAKKDVGGAPAAAGPADKPLDTRGMSGKELLRAALRKRMGVS